MGFRRSLVRIQSPRRYETRAYVERREPLLFDVSAIVSALLAGRIVSALCRVVFVNSLVLLNASEASSRDVPLLVSP